MRISSSEIIFGGNVKVLRNNQVDSFYRPTDFIGSLDKGAEYNALLPEGTFHHSRNSRYLDKQRHGIAIKGPDRQHQRNVRLSFTISI